MSHRIKSLAARSLAALAAVVLCAQTAPAQWVQQHEQFYLEAPHNWVFRDRYMAADRLFNAFDFGHAILYETLWTKPDAPVSALEEKWYNELTKKILIRPPRVPLEEPFEPIAVMPEPFEDPPPPPGAESEAVHLVPAAAGAGVAPRPEPGRPWMPYADDVASNRNETLSHAGARAPSGEINRR